MAKTGGLVCRHRRSPPSPTRRGAFCSSLGGSVGRCYSLSADVEDEVGSLTESGEKRRRRREKEAVLGSARR